MLPPLKIIFFLLNLSQKELEMLWQLDILGLVEQPDSNSAFHEKFTSQFHKTEDGVYETRFPWKSALRNVPRNKELATVRLRSTTMRVEHIGILLEYHEIM